MEFRGEDCVDHRGAFGHVVREPVARVGGSSRQMRQQRHALDDPTSVMEVNLLGVVALAKPMVARTDYNRSRLTARRSRT